MTSARAGQRTIDGQPVSSELKDWIMYRNLEALYDWKKREKT